MKKRFLIVAIGYTIIVFILNNIMETTMGAILMQVSYFALAALVLGFLYKYLSMTIKQYIYNRQNELK